MLDIERVYHHLDEHRTVEYIIGCVKGREGGGSRRGGLGGATRGGD